MGQCYVAVEDGHQQRSHSIGVGFLDVCAGVEQQFCYVFVAFAHGVEQRSFCARDGIALAALGPAAADDACAF